MRVLEINTLCGIRSTGRICTDIADILITAGNECRIAYGRGEVPEKYRAISFCIGSNADVNFHVLQSRIFDNAGWGSTAVTKKFIEWIRQYDPDIIHLHNIHGYYLNVEVLFDYLKSCGKKIIWTLHDCWAFTGHCSHFSAVGCDKWLTGCHDCVQKKRYPTSYLRDASQKNYLRKKAMFTSLENMTIVTPSHWLADTVKQSFLNEYRVIPIYNGIDLNVFTPSESNRREELGIGNRKMVLGVASSWDKSKGLYDIYSLAEQLDRKEYQIVIVGLSDEQKKNLPTSVIGITKTNSIRELAELYTAADVFVNPSVEETMGLTTVEAMACGTPVVVYNATAVPEVVTPETGIVVGKSNVKEMAEAVRHIEKSNMTDNCLTHAKLFDKNVKFKEYMELYYDKNS